MTRESTILTNKEKKENVIVSMQRYKKSSTNLKERAEHAEFCKNNCKYAELGSEKISMVCWNKKCGWACSVTEHAEIGRESMCMLSLKLDREVCLGLNQKIWLSMLSMYAELESWEKSSPKLGQKITAEHAKQLWLWAMAEHAQSEKKKTMSCWDWMKKPTCIEQKKLAEYAEQKKNWAKKKKGNPLNSPQGGITPCV